MDPFFLLGFVLLGALLIGLGLGHKSWQVHRSGQRYVSAPSPKQSGQKRPIPNQRRVNPIRDSNLSRQQSQLQSSHNQVATTGVKRVRPPQPVRTAVAQMGTNHLQKVNPAVRPKQTQINHAQQTNPVFKPTQMRPARQAKSANGSSELRPYPSYSNSSQTQARQGLEKPSRRAKSTSASFELRSPKSRYPVYNQAQGRLPQRDQPQVKKGQIKPTQMRPLRQPKATEGLRSLNPPQPRYPYTSGAQAQQSRQPQRAQAQQPQLQRRQAQPRHPQPDQARIRQAQKKAARRVSLANTASDSLLYADFKLTQMRTPRQTNPKGNQSDPIPPLRINSVAKSTQVGDSMRTKLPSDWPGSFPTE
ncbi:MAG: hypothetical protein QNJ46_22415 [Leptolyngbyaceae cyanobacterium MO_188.B28]|nr:hypothetical protein [Leptolyngbyaceae cyanobacterium MO_188.B28]